MKIRTFPFSVWRMTALMGAVMFFAGCVRQEQTMLDVDQLTPAASQRIVDKAIERARLEAIASTVPTDLVTDQFTDMDPVSEAVDQMANQLISGLTLNRVKRFPIAVLPFSSLRDSVPDELFGERISENFIFPMQQRGYNLVDYRAVSLATTFKSPVSRQNMSALRNQYKIYFVLTGTYAKYEDGVVMNARILDTTTRQVLASAQTHIPNRRLEGRLPGYDPVRALRNGYIIENGVGPLGME